MRPREHSSVDEWNIEIVWNCQLLRWSSWRCERLIRKRQARMKNENRWEKKRKGPKTDFFFGRSTSRKYTSNNLTHQPEKSKEYTCRQMPDTKNKCTNTARCTSSTLMTGLPDYAFYPVRTLHYDFKALLGILQTPQFWNDGSSRFGGRR